ncbi:thermonuclease family protein [Salinarimonas soli]|nr:thermonuclease family protein [Salinarimonas soli]
MRSRGPRRRRLLVGLLAGAAIAAALLWGREEPASLAGQPRVVDGDSLRLAGAAIRLMGIDAPEMAQVCLRGMEAYRCGEEARRHLARLIGGESVTCRLEGRDRYRRHLAHCQAAGVDLGEAMVRDGWAVGYRAHTSLEREARAARRGLWAGTFDRPKEWRKAHAASMLGGVEDD